MSIEKISMTNVRQNFTSKPNERSKNVDRIPTVQDLYEMEDRIIANQEKLFKTQNEMLGKTLQSMATLIYRDHIEDYEQASDDAAMLKLNVNA